MRDNCSRPSEYFWARSCREQVTFTWDDGGFVLDQHAQVDLYSSTSPKQQSMGKHCAALLTPSCRMLSKEAANINFGPTNCGIEPTQGEYDHHNTIDEVEKFI